jgi:hypothetical protein
MISAIPVDHLLDTGKGGSIGVVFIYFNYENDADATGTRLLAAILKQLILDQASSPDEIMALYQRRPPPLVVGVLGHPEALQLLLDRERVTCQIAKAKIAKAIHPYRELSIKAVRSLSLCFCRAGEFGLMLVNELKVSEEALRDRHTMARLARHQNEK